jgi:4-diphosphocytidyl-2-C-methyl-D-erythritol kinase
MRLLCPAKINLHLRVGPLRADGFHSLLSWFCTAGLYDTLVMEPSGDAKLPLITLKCDQAEIPTDDRNLVVKIAHGWAEQSSHIPDASLIPLHADLQKRIPAGAGLGGGSSDGARALLGLNSLWNTHQSLDVLANFSARFGSDLPFFFFGPSSICTGRGEHVRAISRPKPRWVLLMLPSIHMPTAQVYKTFDAMKLGRWEDVETVPDWNAWSNLDAPELLECLVNDLEPPAFAISPALSEHRNIAQTLLGRTVRMSGSGSSLFTLYDRQDEAESAASRLKNDNRFDRIDCVELAP